MLVPFLAAKNVIDELGNKAIKGELNECELEELKKLEDEYSKFLLKSKPEDLFEVVVLSNFNWEPKSETFIKTDIINKNKSTCN